MNINKGSTIRHMQKKRTIFFPFLPGVLLLCGITSKKVSKHLWDKLPPFPFPS